MVNQVESENIDVGEKKYYIITPEGRIFHKIPFEEIYNLSREVWVSICPCCGKIQGYYYSKDEAKKNNKFCPGCIYTHFVLVKRYKGYFKQNVKFSLLIKGWKKYKDIKYPYMEFYD